MRYSLRMIAITTALVQIGCATSSRQAGCLTRSPATWTTVATALNTYANCNAASLLCTDQTITTDSATYTIWQGSCTSAFSVADQDLLLTAAKQQIAAATPPACPTTGKPMSIGRWEYIGDHIVGGTSCVVRVKVHYQCCGGPISD